MCRAARLCIERGYNQFDAPPGSSVFWLRIYGAVVAVFLILRMIGSHRGLKRENDAFRANLDALVSARTEQWKTALSNLEKSYDLTLEALGDALDLRANNTAGHSRRVTAYAIAMARKMGLTKDEIKVIARGAFLHDIGKMAMSVHILLKPTNLTEQEMEIMRGHCYRGYKLISRIPFLAESAEIIYSHHERYDGLGYPRGLKGNQIPQGARLVAVANTLDAITSDFPYRRARSFDDARLEIELQSGRQFDPQIIEVFREIPGNIWEDLRKDVGS